MIRPATVHDVPRVQEIINSHAELGRMLFKSLAQLFEDLRDFAVYEENGEVLGCAARRSRTLSDSPRPGIVASPAGLAMATRLSSDQRIGSSSEREGIRGRHPEVLRRISGSRTLFDPEILRSTSG